MTIVICAHYCPLRGSIIFFLPSVMGTDHLVVDTDPCSIFSRWYQRLRIDVTILLFILPILGSVGVVWFLVKLIEM
jgi:hypothetical protein